MSHKGHARVRCRHTAPGRGGLPNHDEHQLHRADDCDVTVAHYTHAPEPYRDPPPPEPGRRYRGDPLRHHRDQTGDQGTELSYGPGPVAPWANGRPPSEGGVYMPRAPRVDPPRNPYGVGVPRQHRRPEGEARGYPGEQVAR
ncbi:MAG: hypothetical protein QOD88_1198 [Mycobacterium sp.]|nr:hypothetical protein [Mycobacterium sp.]